MFIRQRKRESRYYRLYELSIERYLRGESLARRPREMLLLHSDELESEELSISEFALCSLESGYARRKVYIANIRTFEAESLFLSDSIWDIIRDLVEKFQVFRHIATGEKQQTIGG